MDSFAAIIQVVLDNMLPIEEKGACCVTSSNGDCGKVGFAILLLL